MKAYFEMSFLLQDPIPKLRDFGIWSPSILHGVIVFIIYYVWKYTDLKNPSGLPVVGRRWYEIGNGKARTRFRDDCLAIVRASFKKLSQFLYVSLAILLLVVYFR